MTKFFQTIATLLLCVIALSTFSCEDDISDVGSGLVDTGSTANVMYVDVVSYNTNNDSIRSDEQVLQNAILGVYEEPVFGRAKARFISQGRLGTMNPDFGENAQFDSVVLTIPVYYKSGEDDIEIDTIMIHEADEDSSDPDTIGIRRTYIQDSIYGNTDLPITIQVKEVAEYLYSQDSTYYSNKNIANCTGCTNINQIDVLPTILGEVQVTKSIKTYEKKLSNSTTTEPVVGYRIMLDKNYFQEKFIANQNSADLNDQASFIRNFFRGIELSVLEDQGFLFNFNPSSSDFNLVMYYSYDNPTEEEDDDEDYEERLSNTLAINFTSIWSSTAGYNVQINQFDHSNRSAEFVQSYTNPNTSTGDSRIYLAGLDGTKTIIKIDQNQLNEIKENVLNNDWAIVGAELNLYVDDTYSFKYPPFLFAWNNYKDEDGKNQNLNFSDLYDLYNNYPYSVQFNPMYDYEANSKKYVIRITDFIKSIVEKNETFTDSQVILNMGNFIMSPSSSYTTPISSSNPFYNNRAFNPYRIVLHGNASEDESKKLKLKVYYTKK